MNINIPTKQRNPKITDKRIEKNPPTYSSDFDQDNLVNQPVTAMKKTFSVFILVQSVDVCVGLVIEVATRGLTSLDIDIAS